MENKEWDILDILTLLSFIIQLQSMEDGSRERDIIHQEIEKLHKENQEILQELRRIHGTNN